MAKTVSAFRGASVIKYSSFDMIIFLHNFLLFIRKYEHSKCDRYNDLFCNRKHRRNFSKQEKAKYHCCSRFTGTQNGCLSRLHIIRCCLKESALSVLILRIEPPCTGRFVRWCARSAFYAGEPPARLAISNRTARLLSNPIIPFHKIQKVNSLLGHTPYGRIHNVQPAQER